MVALQIRDVPEEVHEVLVARATARGQSLQAYLLDLVRRHAAQAGNARLLERFADRADGICTGPGDLAALVGDERIQRERDLSA
jgi:antitoxin FitA